MSEKQKEIYNQLKSWYEFAHKNIPNRVHTAIHDFMLIDSNLPDDDDFIPALKKFLEEVNGGD